MEKTNDRISQLPDAVLHYILSMMPMKFIIRTSILSRRWRNLWKPIWAYSTSLDFGPEFAAGKTPEEFVAAVNRYLQLHKAKEIQMFRLLLFLPELSDAENLSRFLRGDVSDAEKWVEFAVAKGVKELHINFRQFGVDEISDCPIWKLHNSIFNCDSVTHLNLSRCKFIPTLNFKGCTNLKTLHLSLVIVTDALLENMLLNLPLLEELSLKDCFGLTHLKVSAPYLPLKSLTVVACLSSYKIEIFAPNLQSFHFYGNFLLMYFKNISSLVDVLINGICRVDRLNDDWITVLHHLEHVKILTLCNVSLEDINLHPVEPTFYLAFVENQSVGASVGLQMYEILHNCKKQTEKNANEWTVQEFLAKSSTRWDPPDVWCLEKLSLAAESRPEDLPIMFHNLQELQLLMDWFGHSFLPYIYSFFKSCPCPCLHKLFIQLTSNLEEPSGRIYCCEGIPSEDTPDIVFGNLKVIKMNNFKGLMQEMQVVKFFLEKAIVLESLVLVAPEKPVGKHSALESKLVKSPLGILREQLLILANASSSDAQILICEYSDDDGALEPTHTEIYRKGMLAMDGDEVGDWFW